MQIQITKYHFTCLTKGRRLARIGDVRKNLKETLESLWGTIRHLEKAGMNVDIRESAEMLLQP